MWSAVEEAKARARAKACAGRRTPGRFAALIRSTAKRLKQAKLIFAHGTNDPVAEAAFLIGETLKIHPDHVDARAGDDT